MTSLNAVAEPMLIKPMAQETAAMTMIAYSGIAESAWTCSTILYLSHRTAAKSEDRHTLLIVRQNGRPLSRPKAKTMRDEVARKAIAAQMSMIMMIQIMTEAPGRDPVASKKICMKGKPRRPDGLARTPSMSTVTNSTTMTTAKPRIPLRSVVSTIHQGITTLAL